MNRIGSRILLAIFTGRICSKPEHDFIIFCSNPIGVPVGRGRLSSLLLHEWVHTAPNTVLDSFLNSYYTYATSMPAKLLFEKQAVLYPILNYIVDHFNIFVRTRSDSSGPGAHRYPPPCCMNEFSHLSVLCMTPFFFIHCTLMQHGRPPNDCLKKKPKTTTTTDRQLYHIASISSMPECQP